MRRSRRHPDYIPGLEMVSLVAKSKFTFAPHNMDQGRPSRGVFGQLRLFAERERDEPRVRCRQLRSTNDRSGGW